MKILILVLLLAGCSVGRGVFAESESASTQYINSEMKIIEKHADALKKRGQMPTDFADTYRVLGTYGWHSDRDVTVQSSGIQPSLNVLRNGGGSFGAYSFFEPAYDQAKRTWFIHGMMKAGSDLLIAFNRNAKLDDSPDGYCLAGCTEEGNKRLAGEKIGTPLGYKVGYMYKGPVDTTVIEIIDRRTVRLSKKADHDVMQYDLILAPADYVDMCGCTMSTK